MRYDFIIGAQTGEFNKGIKASKGSLKDFEAEVERTLKVLKQSPTQFGHVITKELKSAIKELEGVQKKLQGYQAQGKTKKSELSPIQQSQLNARLSTSSSLIKAAQPSVIDAKNLREQQKALSLMQNKSITLRYALYDVGSAAQSASQALLGYANATLTAAIAQESAFSQIQKTLVGQASTQELEKLKQELVDLSTQIPVSFDELTKIGMLGSQLGIAADDIAKFTGVVAKFSAITGLSVEDTAMNFGKIANILGLGADQYQSLGSAIAAVGVKTAATEAQIMSTAGQIGAVAKAAGFSASQVIGLSASFASLKIAPEEARGVVVRTFNEINSAVSTFSTNSNIGGEKLKIFARIAGESSQDFATAWSDKTGGGAANIFNKFVQGLSKSNISKELQRLGLDGVRTSKGLTALANGFDLVTEAMLISREAGMDGTFLDKSFSTIVEDIASKLKMVQNSFENLFAASAGGPLLNLIGEILDSVIALNTGLTDLINNNPLVGSLVKFSIVVAGLTGLLAALASAVAIAGGGFLALRTAYLAAAADGLIFQGSMMGAIAQMLGINVASKPAAASIAGVGVAATGAATGVGALTTSMRLAKLVLASTGIGVVLLLFGEFAKMLMETADATDGPVTGLDEVQQGLKAVRDEANSTTQELVDFINQALLPINNMVKVENALYSLGQSLKNGANDFSQYSAAGRSNITALMAAMEAMAIAGEGDNQKIANNLNALMNYMISAGLGTAEAFAIIRTAIIETGKTAEVVLLPFASLEAGMQDVGSSASGAAREVDKLAEAFKKLDASIKLEETIDAFGQSLTKNGKEMRKFSEGGRTNLNALKDVIFALRDRLANKPQSLANAFASLKVAMIQMGITSKTAFKMIDLAMATTGKKGKALKKIISGLFGAISQSAEEAKPVRTITDYVNDLSSVLDAAFNNRYAKQNASDSISSAWISIKESAEDAKKAIDDANASINEMQADKGILEYQLKVAIRYGDTLRAESIKAKLAKLNQQLTDKQGDLAAAQAEANKSLIGNSKYAIDNRSKVRDLVQSYNDYLVSLAASGMSSKDLKAKAAELANEFLAQGEQMGFARSELLTYTDAFKKDFTTVINNLPRDITLNPVTEPALQAVIDFVKDANIELAKLLSGTITVDISSNFAGGIDNGGGALGGSGGSGSSGGKGKKKKKAAAAEKAKIDAFDAERTKLARSVPSAMAAVDKLELAYKTAKPGQMDAIKKQLIAARAVEASVIARRNEINRQTILAVKKLDSIKPAAKKKKKKALGGLITGPGTSNSDSISAMLSNGEYVVRANAVKYYGTDFMNSLNNVSMNKPAPSTGKSNVVYLSPDDRALLRAAIDRPIALYTENTTIAKSANSGNVILAQRGSR